MPVAMILAAGRGERMRPLTDRCPKPLLCAGGRPLIEWQIQRLAEAGFRDIVVNLAHLGAMIEAALGDGSRFGVRIRYSPEASALETAGGIAQALPLIGPRAFVVANGDVYSDYDYRALLPVLDALNGRTAPLRAHLVLVDNPEHHPGGDFAFDDGRASASGTPKLTFSGIAAYHPALFAGIVRGEPARLAPLLVEAMNRKRVGAEHFRGRWIDVGTPARLAALDADLSR